MNANYEYDIKLEKSISNKAVFVQKRLSSKSFCSKKFSYFENKIKKNERNNFKCTRWQLSFSLFPSTKTVNNENKNNIKRFWGLPRRSITNIHPPWNLQIFPVCDQVPELRKGVRRRIVLIRGPGICIL